MSTGRSNPCVYSRWSKQEHLVNAEVGVGIANKDTIYADGFIYL